MDSFFKSCFELCGSDGGAREAELVCGCGVLFWDGLARVKEGPKGVEGQEECAEV